MKCDAVSDKNNSEVLSNLDEKLCHLTPEQQCQLLDLVHEFAHLFNYVPGRTDLVYHDVDVGEAIPVKQHPYLMNPIKMEHLNNEVKYMLDNDIIEPSDRDWSSPCIFVHKLDGSYRSCTDLKRVNTLSKSDSYPIP